MRCCASKWVRKPWFRLMLEASGPRTRSQSTARKSKGAGRGGREQPVGAKDATPAPSTPSKKRKTQRVAAPVDDALRDKALRIQRQLQGLYPSPEVPLNHESNFQLLVAVMLSAQTTDVKVNTVTPELFSVAPTAEALAARTPEQVLPIIQPLGLAPTKAKNIVATAKLLTERHDGNVPRTFEDLEALPGVGHKTACVVLVQCHGIPAFPVDTHIHRLAARWGLSTGKNVEQTEADIKAIFDPEAWHALHLQMIYFGREHCRAAGHKQADCPICSWAAKT